MALKPLQTSMQPLGQFDGLDSEYLTLKGGEVVTFKSVLKTADQAVADVQNDGYVYADKKSVVTKTLSTGLRPLMLADEGIAGYGTLFGSVVGGLAGQVVTGGAVLGPHTATGSGKVTCWASEGLFAVSLDAVDTTSTTGLQPTNTTLDSGAALYATSAGLLTPNTSARFENVVVGRFIEFDTNGSLVNTPSWMVSALNSPYGATGTSRTFSFATFLFNPGV